MKKKNIKSLVEEIQKEAQAKPPTATWDLGSWSPTGTPSGTTTTPTLTLTPNAPTGGGGGGGGGQGGASTSWDLGTWNKQPPKPVGGGGGGGGGGAYVSSVAAVKEMQKSIQNFAKVAVNYKTKMVKQPVPNKPGQTTTVEMMDGEDDRKDFNDFIAEQYTNAGTTIHGVEFDPDEGATAKDQKRPTDNIDMDNVLDGLRRIGSPKPGEKIPDGFWDFRTQNSVMETYALADALTQITNFMGAVPQKGDANFKAADLAKFAAAIPKVKEYPATSKQNEFLTKMSQADLKEKAEIITGLVDKLSNFYQFYYKYVLNHPAYTAAIKKKTPLINVKPGGEDRGAVPEKYADVMNQLDKRYISVVLHKKDGKYFTEPLPLSVLKDVQSFRSLILNKLGYDEDDVNNASIQAKVLGEVILGINDALSKEPVQIEVPAPQPKVMSTGTPSLPPNMG